jgi:two-component system sensor histidine kinase/response regulator
MRVLVAEDNATNQYLIRTHLEADGHAVTTVENGAQAVRAVETSAFDVVLMDIQMPEMDGPAAARAIRALPGPAARLPIVALTASALPGDRESYMAAGMTDFVSKPVDLAALRAALRRAGAALAEPAAPG